MAKLTLDDQGQAYIERALTKVGRAGGCGQDLFFSSLFFFLASPQTMAAHSRHTSRRSRLTWG